MKILHLIPGLKNASGPTRAAIALADHMAQLGHDVTLGYITGRGTDPRQALPANVRVIGFPASLLKKWAFSPALHQYLRRHLQGFDMVHVHGIWTFVDLSLGYWATKYRIPYWIRPAGSLDPIPLQMKGWKKRVYLQLLQRSVLNRAVALHAVSDQEAGHLRQLGFDPPVIHIPNGINMDDFKSSEGKLYWRKVLDLPPKDLIFLYVGRIHPIKNLELIGEVFQSLPCDAGMSVLVIIAGPDDHRYAAQLKDRFHKLGLGSKVRFYGEVHGVDKVQLLHACDVFVLPSHTENFAFSALEALSAGLPVLASDRTPWRDLDEKNAGWWRMPDRASFRNVVDWILQHPEQVSQMADQAKILAASFDWNTISQQLLVEYQRQIPQKTLEAQAK